MNEKELKTKSPAYMGKVRSNFMGTEFTVYDKGLNPKRKAATIETFREELAIVMYQSNLLGAKGPRKMRVLLPAVNAEGERYRWKPASKDLSMLNKYKAGDLTGMFDFFNKPPKWNERRP
jgi:tubby-related protein 1